MTTATKKTNLPTSEDFKNLVDLMALNCEATARMDELENGLNQDWIDCVDARRKDYAELQLAIGQSEQAIEDLVILNPQWFEKVKTLKTPYGSVSLRKSTRLEVASPEVTIALLEGICGANDEAFFIRTEKTLNLEALETMSDLELARIKVKRISSESLSIKPAKPDLGKAVKAIESADKALES